jgi:hypothetical protein
LNKEYVKSTEMLKTEMHLTSYRTRLIFKIHEQVITLQIKVHNIFRVQILQPECCIHRYDEPLTAIEVSASHKILRYTQ